MKKDTLYLIVGLGALLLLGGGGFAVYTMTRGLRNNNPGNIRLNGSIAWLGQSPSQLDPDFVQFSSPEYGIRALARLLSNYYTRYNLDTVDALISRYAPSTENNTHAYIDSVANSIGVDAYTPIDVNAYLPSLISAIIRHENGLQPYSGDTILKGISLA